MLLDVAALSTSVALGPVAEAFSALEISTQSIVVEGVVDTPSILPDLGKGTAGVLSSVSQVVSGAASAITLPGTTSVSLSTVVSATTGNVASTVSSNVAALAPSAVEPSVDAPAETVPGATGTTVIRTGNVLLDQIATLPAEQVGAYIRSHTDALDGLIATPPAARDLALWWTSLKPGARSAMLSQAPEVLGNLEGIPYSVRDVANRTVLNSTIGEVNRTISRESGRTLVEQAQQQLKMLNSISEALRGGSADAKRTLLTLDITGQGRAAIVVGDIATADYVTYLVPGMFFTIEGQMTYWTEAADRMRTQELDWLNHFGETGSTVATVAWIGYHTPNLTNVGSIDTAEEASNLLADTIEGVQSIRTGNEPFVSVVAHSYGSTAAMLALANDDFSVDALAVVGSPGSPAHSVKDLHVGQMFVGEAPFDPVPNTAFFGNDPGAPGFGATLFGTAGTTDPITGEALGASFFHIEYFAPGTESLRNLSLISIGRGSDITPG